MVGSKFDLMAYFYSEIAIPIYKNQIFKAFFHLSRDLVFICCKSNDIILKKKKNQRDLTDKRRNINV